MFIRRQNNKGLECPSVFNYGSFYFGICFKLHHFCYPGSLYFQKLEVLFFLRSFFFLLQMVAITGDVPRNNCSKTRCHKQGSRTPVQLQSETSKFIRGHLGKNHLEEAQEVRVQGRVKQILPQVVFVGKVLLELSQACSIYILSW